MLIFNDVQDSRGDRAADRVPAKSVEIFDASVTKSVRDFLRSDDGANRMSIALKKSVKWGWKKKLVKSHYLP